MNNIKTKLIALAVGGALVLGPVACKDEFLEVPVTGQLSEAQFQSEQGLQGLLIGVYSMLNGKNTGWFGGATNWLWGSIRGGEANKGSNAGDFNTISPFVRFEQDPTNPLLESKWNGSYEGIARANILLQNLAASDQVSEERKTAMAAEARFLRGHYYYELRKNFNNVPWVDESMTTTAEVVEVTNTAEIFPRIEADLQFAYENLPETQPQTGRVNKWAAASYLAKVYMFQDKYAEAKQLFDLIIAQGQTSGGQKYGLVPNFEDVFRGENENNEESIFAFQAAAGTGSTNTANHDLAMNYPYNTGPAGPGNCCGFYQPSFELANSYRTTLQGLPYLDGEYNLPGNALRTDQGLLSDQPFTPDPGPVDPRLDHTIARRGIMFLDWQEHPGFSWIRDQGFAGPYTQKKLSYQKAEEGSYLEKSGWTPGYHSINFQIIRFADVLLMAAEAEIEVGSMEKALEYVNMVRQRAKNSPLLVNGVPAANYVISLYDAWPNQETARMAVRMERKLELALEGKRFYDLLRWGVVAEAMNNYLNYEAQFLPSQFAGAKFTPGQDEYLPIPQRQIDLQGSEILQQNQGY